MLHRHTSGPWSFNTLTLHVIPNSFGNIRKPLWPPLMGTFKKTVSEVSEGILLASSMDSISWIKPSAWFSETTGQPRRKQHWMVPLDGCLISQLWALHLMTKPRSISPLKGTMGSTRSSPIPSFRPSVVSSFGTKWLLCSGNIPSSFFRATIFPQTFPRLFRGPFPLGLDTLATLGSGLESDPAAFKGQSRQDVTNRRTIETPITLRILRGMTIVTLIPPWTPFFTHPKPTSLLFWVRRFLFRFILRILRILRDPWQRWHTQSSSFHGRSCLRGHAQTQLFSFSLHMLGVVQDRLCCRQLIQVQLLADHVETICHLWGFSNQNINTFGQCSQQNQTIRQSDLEFPVSLNKPSPGSNPIQNFMNIGTTLGIRDVLQQFGAFRCTSRLKGDACTTYTTPGQWSAFELIWFLLGLDQE